jgi:hypothetical protein
VLVIVLMRLGWYAAMVAVTVLALLPNEHLQMPVFDWWDKAQHALAFVAARCHARGAEHDCLWRRP